LANTGPAAASNLARASSSLLGARDRDSPPPGKLLTVPLSEALASTTEMLSLSELSEFGTGLDTAGNRNRGGQRSQINNCLKHLFILSNGQPAVSNLFRKIVTGKNHGDSVAIFVALAEDSFPLFCPKLPEKTREK
jgi:hypothetical protein